MCSQRLQHTERPKEAEGGRYHQRKVFTALLIFLVEKLIHKTSQCVWHCNCTTRPLQVTCSTHSFQLNISHLKPVKSCSFILLNPALHDRTSLGASPSSGVVWCGVCGQKAGNKVQSITAVTVEQERRMASGQVSSDTTNTLHTIPASQQHVRAELNILLSDLLVLLVVLRMVIVDCSKFVEIKWRILIFNIIAIHISELRY